jgi:HEAT repeat protein
MSDARAQNLRERAARSDATVEERLIAWEALREADRAAPEIGAQLAALAESTQNPDQRIRLFNAFEDHSDPAFLPPLIQGLQDPNPFVREQAADALGEFRSNPAVQEWLLHLSQSDPDSAVRRQAYRNLPEPQP